MRVCLTPETSIKTAAPLLSLALTMTLLTTGCSTTKSPFSNRMASIVVTNRTPDQIEDAVRTVFTSHGYEEGKPEDDELMFQKPGSFMSGMIYGDWYSGGVWERIKVYQRELDSARTVVDCDGYMVQEHDDPLFQNEKREHKTKRGHLQALLDEVAKELQSAPAAPKPVQAK